MPDERSGTLAGRIARLRVPLGFLSGAVVLWLATPTRTSLVIGALIALVGEALRIWAAGHLVKSEEVARSGPYRWLAHPLYVGSSIIGGGVAVASGSVPVGLIVAAYLAVTIAAAVRHEEAFLGRKFGAEYASYRRGASSRPPRAERVFRLDRVMANREYRAASGLVGAVLLLLLKATYNGAL